MKATKSRIVQPTINIQTFTNANARDTDTVEG